MNGLPEILPDTFLSDIDAHGDSRKKRGCPFSELIKSVCYCVEHSRVFVTVP